MTLRPLQAFRCLLRLCLMTLWGQRGGLFAPLLRLSVMCGRALGAVMLWSAPGRVHELHSCSSWVVAAGCLLWRKAVHRSNAISSLHAMLSFSLQREILSFRCLPMVCPGASIAWTQRELWTSTRPLLHLDSRSHMRNKSLFPEKAV